MDPEKNRQIDEWLDAALKRYGEVEPRAGLENRVLTSVRARRELARTPRWQWWPVLAAVTAILVVSVGVFLAWSGGNAKSASTAKDNALPSIDRPIQVTGPEVQQAARDVHHAVRPAKLRATETTAAPRIAQFPAPQPLSEQEIMLARYIEQFPREATLMARAQTELTRQEMIERQTPAESPISDPELQTQ